MKCDAELRLATGTEVRDLGADGVSRVGGSSNENSLAEAPGLQARTCSARPQAGWCSDRFETSGDTVE